MGISAIYKIQSLIKPERIYIGSAVNISSRWNLHLNYLKNNKHHSIKLQNHYNKYSKSDLCFSIVEPCFPQFLTVREQYYLNTLKPFFNICKTAGSPLGLKRSDESKQKNREAHLGKKATSETKQKLSIANKGKIITEETRQKYRISKMGNKYSSGCTHICSEETKKKLSERIISEEWKQKIRIAQTGKKDSDETRKKKSESHKGLRLGIPLSDEHKQKLSEARKGKHNSLITEFKKGQISWNKGKKMNRISADSAANCQTV